MTSNPDSDASQKAREEIEEICKRVISDNWEWRRYMSEERRTQCTEPYPATALERVFVAGIELYDYALSTKAFKL